MKHYNHSLLLRPIRDEDGEIAHNLDAQIKAWISHILQRLRPSPPEIKHPDPRRFLDVERDWRVANWGTQWDIYGARPSVALPGDGGIRHLAFCTAWGPPNVAMRRLMVADAPRHACAVISWIGIDPADGTVHDLIPAHAH